MATLGNTEVRSGEQTTATVFPTNASTISACQFPLQVNDATFTSMSIFYDAGTNGNVRGMVFTDGPDAPASLIALSVPTSVVAGWNTLNFTQPFVLNSGNYWLGIMGDSPLSTQSLSSVTGKNRVGNQANTFPTVTTSFLSVTSSNFQKAVYATFTTPSVFNGAVS